MLGHLLNENSSSLHKTREKVILYSFYVAVIVCFLLFLIRLFEQRVNMSIISFVAIIISIIFLYFTKKGKGQTILFLASLMYLSIAFYEGYSLNMPPQTVIYFSLLPAIIAFLLNSNIARLGLFTISLTAFTILNSIIHFGDWSNIFTYCVICIFCYGIVLFFINILENQQIKLEIALSEKKDAIQALEEKHQETLLFNDMMNHDIKAPIRTIKGFTKILLKKTKPTSEQVEYLEFISNSAQNLERLIYDLLTLTKINTVKMEYSTVNTSAIIDQINYSLGYDIKNKNVTLIIDENLPTINGNLGTISTVFQNIISNAIKYQPKEEAHIPTVEINYQEEEKFHVFQFQDNGIGITEEQIPKIFNPFVRFHSKQDYEGTGLGMTISQKIMEKHNGTIQYISNDKAGSCFELKFPK